EAKDLLQNLEKLQLQQNEVITPPPPADDDVEETTEPPSKKPRIRKKRSKAVLGAEDVGKEKATPEKQRPKAKPSSRSPPLSGGATSSGNNRVVDAGEDAQPTFPSDSLPTAFQSTQKVFTPTRKSLLCSFDNAEDPPPEQVHVLSLDPAPEFASETDDELLKYALHLNMVEVTKPEPDDSDKETESDQSDVAAKLAQLSKAEESKLEAILRRELRKVLLQCNGQKEGFLEKVNHTYRQNRSKEFKVRSGFYTDQMMADELKFTKDKYQKKLIWYWCDVAYEGTKANRDEEELLRDTTISDGARVRDVALGLGASLPDLDSQDEADNDADDDEDEDEDEEDDEEADEPKAKLGKRKSKDNLPDDVEEDMDGVPGLLNEMLSLQSRCNKLLDRDVESFKKLIVELGSKHDELADMKSAYDCEEPVDAATLACISPAD
ncbi:unnamed protein product, partial [Symbiodinium necroappetens]